MAIELKTSRQAEEGEPKVRHSMRLRDVLELTGSPVAVAIVPDSPQHLKNLQHKATVCMMIQMARNGATFCSSGNNILCGGRANLGVGESPLWKLDDFLVRREKLFSTKVAARKLLELDKKQAPDQGKHLAFSPLETASFTPDVVLFIGTPAQLSRIIFLDAFRTGVIDTIHGEPLCSGVIAMPITTGKIGISFLDASCRLFGKYRPEEMAVGVPYQKLLRIVDNIDLSSAGTARPSFLLRLAGSWLRRRVPENSR